MSQGAQEGRLLAARYRLLSVVGQGGMGTVWRARDEVLDRDVAVKEVIVRADLADNEREVLHHRTLREARATARLSHPAIVTVHDVVDEDRRPWIVMELVAARSLQEVIDADGPLPPRRVAEIGRQTLGALQAAHAVGILHRDVKPGNVLITAEGRAVLTDFGIAQVEGDSALTHTGILVGSPAFIAPERVKGERATGASDLWALGATLYSACEGRPPYRQTSAMAVLAAILTDDPPPPANAGPLTPVLQGLMHRDPVHRLDAGAAAGLLSQVANGTAPSHPPGSGPGEGMPWTGSVTPPGHDATARNPWPAPVPGPTRPGNPTAQIPYGDRPGPESSPAPVPAPMGGGRSSGLFITIGVLLAVIVVLAAFLIVRPDLTSQSGSGQDPTGEAPSGGPSASSSAASSSAASPSSSPTTEAPLPPGWQKSNGPDGTTVGVPAGWRRSAERASVFWRDPRSAAYLQIDTTPWTGRPYEAWQTWEGEVMAKGTLKNYHRVDLRTVTGTPYEAADIEFTWNGAGGARMHGVDRRVLVGGRRYAIFVAVPADRWNTSQDQVNGFLDTFSP
jgi:serine/threonine protein kinase